MEKIYYFSHWLWLRNVPLIPRVLMLVIRLVYGSFVPYQVSIGKNVSFGHKMGIVINRDATFGDNVKIRHQVTFGSGGATVGDNVTFGAGVKVIGNVTIGNDAIIGANAVVVKDIPAGAVAVGVPANTIKYQPGYPK